MGRRHRQDLVARARRFSERSLAFTEQLQRSTRLPRRFIENFAAAGTAIGNNLAESQTSITRKLMAASYRIALREARGS